MGFSHTNPYISKVTQQCRGSLMLIFRAWATCGDKRLGTRQKENHPTVPLPALLILLPRET